MCFYGYNADLNHVLCLTVAKQLRLNCVDDLFVPTDMVWFPFSFPLYSACFISKWSTTSTRGSSKRGQSVPVDPSKRTNPEEKGLQWRDLGEIDVRKDYLYPDDAVTPRPVEKVEQLSPEQQPVYIQ